MNYFFVKAFFGLVLALPLLPARQAGGWELQKEAAGIKVYTREAEHSNIKEFKASSRINASLPVIFNILRAVDKYPRWIEDVQFAEIVNQGEQLLEFYYQLKLPWPMKNRDIAMVMQVTRHGDESATLTLTSKPDLVPEKDGFIRMREVAGKWHLQAVDANRCEVTYQFLADPEGLLPAWVVNIFIVDGPFKTLQNLNSYAKDYPD